MIIKKDELGRYLPLLMHDMAMLVVGRGDKERREYTSKIKELTKEYMKEKKCEIYDLCEKEEWERFGYDLEKSIREHILWHDTNDYNCLQRLMQKSKDFLPIFHNVHKIEDYTDYHWDDIVFAAADVGFQYVMTLTKTAYFKRLKYGNDHRRRSLSIRIGATSFL